MIDKSRIDYLIREGKIRPRSPDYNRINSLIDSSIKNAEALKKIELTSQSSTIIFREYYECIRQLGDARLWFLGYESFSHDISMEILSHIDIKDKVKLNKLDRFRKTRNNANYRGYLISIEEAKEISDFWKSLSKELIRKIKS